MFGAFGSILIELYGQRRMEINFKVPNDPYQTFAHSGDDLFRLFVKIAYNICLYTAIINFRSPISLYNAMKVIQWQPSQQAGPTLTTFTEYCTNFLFDCLLLHGHTLCNIIKQGTLGVCVSVCFSCLVRPILGKKKQKKTGPGRVRFKAIVASDMVG